MVWSRVFFFTRLIHQLPKWFRLVAAFSVVVRLNLDASTRKLNNFNIFNMQHTADRRNHNIKMNKIEERKKKNNVKFVCFQCHTTDTYKFIICQFRLNANFDIQKKNPKWNIFFCILVCYCYWFAVCKTVCDFLFAATVNFSVRFAQKVLQ